MSVSCPPTLPIASNLLPLSSLCCTLFKFTDINLGTISFSSVLMAHKRSSSRFSGSSSFRSHLGLKSSSALNISGGLMTSYSSPNIYHLIGDISSNRCHLSYNVPESSSAISSSTSHNDIRSQPSSSGSSNSFSSENFLCPRDSMDMSTTGYYIPWDVNHMGETTLSPSPFTFLTKRPKLRLPTSWKKHTVTICSLLPHSLWERIVLFVFLAYLSIFLHALAGQGNSANQTTCRLPPIEENNIQVSGFNISSSFIDAADLGTNRTEVLAPLEPVTTETNDTLAQNQLEGTLGRVATNVPIIGNMSNASSGSPQMADATFSLDSTRADAQ